MFDDGRQGLAARLTVTLIQHGVGAIHPDPATMAFTHVDAAFGQAIGEAWAWCQPPADVDVRWSITPLPGSSRDGLLFLAGPSLGVAFAVALRHLLDDSPIGDQWAITGALSPDGTVRGVEGYSGKLRAAKRHHLNLLIPRSDLAKVEALPQRFGDDEPRTRLQTYSTIDLAVHHVAAFHGPMEHRYTVGPCRGWEPDRPRKLHSAFDWTGDYHKARTAWNQFWTRYLGQDDRRHMASADYKAHYENLLAAQEAPPPLVVTPGMARVLNRLLEPRAINITELLLEPPPKYSIEGFDDDGVAYCRVPKAPPLPVVRKF